MPILSPTRIARHLLATLILPLALLSCSTVPITGRRQLNLVDS